MEKESRHTVSVLVQNEFGALSRIAALFSGRGYNIESLSVAPTLDPALSRMTIVTIAGESVIEQIIKQLNKLVPVVRVRDITGESALSRVLALIKVNLSKRNRKKLEGLLRGFDAKISFSDDKCSIVQAAVDDSELEPLLEKLAPFGIMEYVSTGSISLHKGKKVIQA